MEYVVRIPRDANGARPADLVELLETVAGALGLKPGEFRDLDLSEPDAIADVLAELRDTLGITDQISYHACQHDQGVGDCTAMVQVR